MLHVIQLNNLSTRSGEDLLINFNLACYKIHKPLTLLIATGVIDQNFQLDNWDKIKKRGKTNEP